MRVFLGIIIGCVLMFVLYPYVIRGIASREDIFNAIKDRTRDAMRETAEEELRKEVERHTHTTVGMDSQPEPRVVIINGSRHVIVNGYAYELVEPGRIE